MWEKFWEYYLPRDQEYKCTSLTSYFIKSRPGFWVIWEIKFEEGTVDSVK